jgi:hypothetical protein
MRCAPANAQQSAEASQVNVATIAPTSRSKTLSVLSAEMTDQVRQAVEKADKKAYGRKKVLRFYDVRLDEKMEGAKAVSN